MKFLKMNLLMYCFIAHEKIKKLVAWQKEIQQEVGVAKEDN